MIHGVDADVDVDADAGALGFALMRANAVRWNNVLQAYTVGVYRKTIYIVFR
jgi:hypothetical protein